MKKQLTLFTLLLAQWVSAQCNNPCDQWYGSSVLHGFCRPGFYVGAHVGHTWIQTPKLGFIEVDIEGEQQCSEIQGQRGEFSWGAFGGYNSCFWLPNFYVGFEGGYHNNGSSTFFVGKETNLTQKIAFSESFKCCKLWSHDWDISATFDYTLLNCLDIFFKAGGASLREEFTTYGLIEDEKTSTQVTLKQWAPVIQAGFGYCIYDFLRATLSYRGVICHKHNRFKEMAALEEECRTLPQLVLTNCSSVQSVYGGLTFTF